MLSLAASRVASVAPGMATPSIVACRPACGLEKVCRTSARRQFRPAKIIYFSNDICIVCSGSWRGSVQPGLDGPTSCNLILDQPSLIVRLTTVASQHLEEAVQKDDLIVVHKVGLMG